jgi:hypothetical protein
MRHRVAALAIAVLVVVGGMGTSPAGENKIDRAARCVGNPALIGSCFTVQGRALMSNGTPGFRIMWTGTKRVLGVLPAEDEIVPACLARAVTATSEVTGSLSCAHFPSQRKGTCRWSACRVSESLPRGNGALTSGRTLGQGTSQAVPCRAKACGELPNQPLQSDRAAARAVG